MENICYDTLKEWAEDNAAVPQDENRAFVIAYKVDSKIWCGFENLMFDDDDDDNVLLTVNCLEI